MRMAPGGRRARTSAMLTAMLTATMVVGTQVNVDRLANTATAARTAALSMERRASTPAMIDAMRSFNQPTARPRWGQAGNANRRAPPLPHD